MSLTVLPVDSPALLDRFLSVSDAVYEQDADAVRPLRALLRRRLEAASSGGRETSAGSSSWGPCPSIEALACTPA